MMVEIIAVIAFGIVILFQAIKIYYIYQDAKVQTARTKGEIIDYKYRYISGRKSYFFSRYRVYPLARFYVDGKEYRVRSIEYMSARRDKELHGNVNSLTTEVEIAFDPYDPTNARIIYSKKQKRDIIKSHWLDILLVILLICISFMYF